MNAADADEKRFVHGNYPNYYYRRYQQKSRKGDAIPSVDKDPR